MGLATDANGIVNVSAKDKASGKQQQIRIQSSGGLSDSDIERMVQEAEQFASADADRKAKVETKNEADSTVYQVCMRRHHLPRLSRAFPPCLPVSILPLSSADQSLTCMTPAPARARPASPD